MPAKRARAGKPCRPKSTQRLDQIYQVFGHHHHSYRSYQNCICWILRFIRFNDIRRPAKIHKL